MDSKYYHYYSFGGVLQRAGSWLMLLLVAAFTGVAMLQRSGVFVCLLVSLVIVLPVCLFNAYMYPRIGICDGGMLISFLFRDILIPWEDIIDVRRVWFLPRTLIIRARRVTPFHIVYGVVYSGSLFPSFLISASIDDYHELVGEIQRKVQNWCV